MYSINPKIRLGTQISIYTALNHQKINKKRKNLISTTTKKDIDIQSDQNDKGLHCFQCRNALYIDNFGDL